MRTTIVFHSACQRLESVWYDPETESYDRLCGCGLWRMEHYCRTCSAHMGCEA